MENAASEPGSEKTIPPLDELDRRLLNRVQSDFPIAEHPFDAIGRELGISGDAVIERLAYLKDAGIIRRIGGNFVPAKLGYVSTLCAARVPDKQIDDFAAVVNRFTGVTHNYIRDNRYNVWFTFIAPSMEVIEANLKAISRETGVNRIINLPATRVFKIRAHFDV